MPIKINAKKGGKSLSASIKTQAEEIAEPQVKQKLAEIGDYATRISPVWSGAYVKSFSFVPFGSGSGRMRTSKLEDDNRAMEDQIVREAQNNLRADLNKIDLTEVNGVVLRNRSPHARAVESGPTPRSPTGYAVFAKVKDRFR